MMLQSNRSSRRTFRVRSRWGLHLALTLFAILTYAPFAFIIINSFKNNEQYYTNFWLPAFPLHFENFEKAFPQMLQAILNSFSYTLPTVLLVLVVSALGGYAFGRYRFPLREPLFVAVLALIMLPGILLVIPMFSLVVDLGWTNSLQGVALPWTSVQIVIGLFIMRTFFESLPSEYFDAARLDGASELTLLREIAAPLAVPAFGTLGVLTLLFCWNDLLWPLIVLFEEAKQPVAVGVLQFGTQYGTDYGATFAAYVLASLPLIVIFAFTSRYFMNGLQGGVSL